MTHKWYYRIETEPGVYTPGRPIATLGALKDIYRKIEFDSAAVLDIGTQEFVNPILIQHQGASQIVAYDRQDLTEALEFLQSIYDLSRLEYISGIPLIELRRELNRKGLPTIYDVVNFTGVLYHMPDPLVGLAIARSFLRQGGLMILETSVLRDDASIDFNTSGRYYPGSNYFQLSAQLIAYWCNMLHMEILDVSWLGGGKIARRLILVLRATAHVVAADDDEWIKKHFIQKEFQPYGLDLKSLASDATPLEYTPSGTLKMDQSSIPVVDIKGTLAEMPALDSEVLEHRLSVRKQVSRANRKRRWWNLLTRSNKGPAETPKEVADRINSEVEARFKLTRRNSLNFDDLE